MKYKFELFIDKEIDEDEAMDIADAIVSFLEERGYPVPLIHGVPRKLEVEDLTVS